MSAATELPKKDLSSYWREYFVANTTSLLEIPWGRGAEITAAERHAIASSIQEFQLGEAPKADTCSGPPRLSRSALATLITPKRCGSSSRKSNAMLAT